MYCDTLPEVQPLIMPQVYQKVPEFHPPSGHYPPKLQGQLISLHKQEF